MANGIDGIWNDMNEPSVFDGPGGTMPENNIHLGGGNLPIGSHLMYHNAYGRLMVEASYNGMMAANPGKRPFLPILLADSVMQPCGRAITKLLMNR